MKELKILVLLIVIVALAGFASVLLKIIQKQQPTTPIGAPVKEPATETAWTVYQNQDYGFEISYPLDWTVAVDNTQFEPKINIYKKSETAKLPFTHHNDVANVSIFPKGIPSEGVLGTTGTSTISFKEEPAQAFDYVLQNGEHWATYATFKNSPAGWEPFGFVWARASVRDHVQKCLIDGKESAIDRCFSLGEAGAQVTDTGTVAQDERAVEVKILESFHFLP